MANTTNTPDLYTVTVTNHGGQFSEDKDYEFGTDKKRAQLMYDNLNAQLLVSSLTTPDFPRVTITLWSSRNTAYGPTPMKTHENDEYPTF